MVLTLTGRIADETGAALPNLTVEAHGDWLLTTEQLAHDGTNRQGRFTLKVLDVVDTAGARGEAGRVPAADW